MQNRAEASSRNYFIAWREKGENHWEVLSRPDLMALLAQLNERKVNMATVMVYQSMFMSWLFPDYHRGCHEVNLRTIYEEINGVETPSDYSRPDLPPAPSVESEKLYGYIAPDGRYFKCEYGGHSALARKIVGSFQQIDDPVRYLEKNGWLVIYHDPLKMGNYAVGMEMGMKATDAQVKRIQAIGLPTNARNLCDFL